MLNEIIYAVLQAITEFLPISSDGHIALASNLLGSPNLAFITFLHLASLLAVIIFTRKEILEILKFNKQSWKIIFYIFIGIFPAVVAGSFFSDFIEASLNSLLFIGIFFLFTGIILASTKFFKSGKNNVNAKSSLGIGLMQALALLPGISRSGMTISSALWFRIEKEKAVKFSFLMFIPLALGAFAFEFFKHPSMLSSIPLSTLFISFVICFVLSLLFLNMLNYIVKTEKFWLFSIYCFFIALISFFLYF